MMGRTLLITVAALLFAPDAVDPMMVQLQLKLDRMKSLSGRFIQRLDSGLLAGPRTEEGRLFLRKPSLMRWEYEKPEEKLAIADGRNTWLYIPADRQVQKGSMHDLEEEGAASLLLSGRISLVKDFRSRRLPDQDAAARGAPGAVAIELTPARKRTEVEKVILVIQENGLLIRSLTVVNHDGDRMILELFDLEEDSDLADTLFKFNLPPGVDVLSDH